MKRTVLLAVLFFAGASALSAQTKHARNGFWFNGGLGFGSLGCEDCDARETGPSGGLSLGERSVRSSCWEWEPRVGRSPRTG